MNTTVQADTGRLMMVAKAAYAASAAIALAQERLRELRQNDPTVMRMLSVAAAALHQCPGQLNHYVRADSAETTKDALHLYGLPPDRDC